VYDYTGKRNPEQWIRTTKEIATYVGRTYKKYTAEFTEAVRTLVLDDPIELGAPDPTDVAEFEVWKLDIRDHRAKAQEYENFRAGFYTLVLGQCSEAMEDRLRSHVKFDNANLDGTSLLIIIKTLLYTFEERRMLSDAIWDVKEKYYAMKQGRNMLLQKYHEHYNALAQVLDEVGVNIADDALIEAIAAENGRADAPEEADREEAKQQALAVRFIRGTNAKHTGYITHLQNSYLDGQDHYPVTLHGAYHILQRREGNDSVGQLESDGLAFAQGGDGTPRNTSDIRCYNCQEMGHYANECPLPDNREQVQGATACTQGVEEEEGKPVQSGFSFSQSNASSFCIPKS
jgi:hypothetical protein